jgi:hypothetical protein
MLKWAFAILLAFTVYGVAELGFGVDPDFSEILVVLLANAGVFYFAGELR